MGNLVVRALQNALVPVNRSVQTDAYLTDNGAFSLLNLISKKKVVVNRNTALSLSAVYNAVDQISNDIAKLPKAVFQKTDVGRFRISGHPLDYLISKRPNPNMTQFNYHKAMVINAMLSGNGISVILRNPTTGIQTGLDLIDPDDLKSIKRKDGRIYYDIKGYGVLSSEDVFHVPGFSFNGINGVSIFKYAALNMGAAMSAEAFADENFKSKGLVAGIIKSDKSLKPSAKALIGNAMETRLSKGDVNNIGVLDEGMDFTSISVNAQEASLIDWKKISIEDVARWFNIAPHKIKHLQNATYSNIEQQSLEHGSDTIAPWAKRFEEEYDYKCFTQEEHASFYVKFNTNALIRTDVKTKSEYYGRAINFGWHTRNEIRDLEDYNRIEGLDEPLTPANTLTMAQMQNTEENGN